MRIAIVEDHAMFREVCHKICVEECGFEVVFSVGTAASAMQLLSAYRPSALLLDVGLPDGDGFLVAEAALRHFADIRLYVLTSHISEYVLQQAQRLKVHGFIHKACRLEYLKGALRALGEGKSCFSPEFIAAKAAWHADSGAATKRLTDSEQRILTLVARGLSDEEIASTLGISKKTAETHRSNILRRLGLSGTPKLMAFAIERGFGLVR